MNKRQLAAYRYRLVKLRESNPEAFKALKVRLDEARREQRRLKTLERFGNDIPFGERTPFGARNLDYLTRGT